ncbi:bactofilin family protein [Rhodovarius crocodyli]|uniref:bactofilin family protein n=1 Tax=Rhodovarius crocodyli TaxID=1979269 RepID=UPI001F0B9059|nr:polymer-forming cytoskeletal protein [Rhodovarius crocodyli]
MTVPAARDADLTAANLRPAAPAPSPAKEAPALSQSIRPTAAPAPNAPAGRPGLPTPGVGVPARPNQGGLPASQSDRRTLTVGKGISVQGTVSDCERLVVEGTVESEMLQAAELSVGQTGVFRGEVQVEDAEIAGLFDGTITARGNLIIRATGKVNGVARCKRLSVEDGGQLMGRMEMLTDGPAAPRPAPQV